MIQRQCSWTWIPHSQPSACTMIQRQCSETTAFLSTTLTCTMIPRQCAVFPSRTYQWKLVALWGVTSSHVTSCGFKALSLCLKLHCWEFKESKITNHNHGDWHEIPLWYLYSLPYIVLQTRVDHNRWILQAMMVGSGLWDEEELLLSSTVRVWDWRTHLLVECTTPSVLPGPPPH